MEKSKFSLIADSLRQYRRADLKDFEKELNDNSAIDLLYVDPLPSDAILSQVLAPTTTFLLGRKGTGKSTIFAKAQSVIREEKENLSIYIDVKSLYDLIGTFDVPITQAPNISQEVLQAHLLRKFFLSSVLVEISKELKKSVQALSFFDKIKGKKKAFDETIDKMAVLEGKVKKGELTISEIPILQLITKKGTDKATTTTRNESEFKFTGSYSDHKISSDFLAQSKAFDELLLDNELYQDYSDAILQSFPFWDILDNIKSNLHQIGVNRLIIFFDDFSEINYLSQKLFVDVILSPLNNSSEEKIKLKIAGYPGRVYFGKIDHSKVDIINLDFSNLYKDRDIQTTESRAIDYTNRLLSRRFESFGVKFEDYFDTSTSPKEEYIRLLFECSFNVPRILGFILNSCYKDRIVQGQLISIPIIKLAAQKYYDSTLSQYFDQQNRYVIEPFEQKLDRHIQKELLVKIVDEARSVRKRIASGEIGGEYFKKISNSPVSHFYISRDMEEILHSLEFNFLVSKYHEMRDKDGKEISVYALFYGICEAENIPWGYPKGRRDDRSYFVQRCFSYNHVLHEFLAQKQTIRCQRCGKSYPMSQKSSFELFKWHCPECQTGICRVVNLAEEYKQEIEALNKDLMLGDVELQILQVLYNENRPMRAAEISAMIDKSHQLIGRRTSKLSEQGYVDKSEKKTGIKLNVITERAKSIFFPDC